MHHVARRTPGTALGSSLATNRDWVALKEAVTALQALQVKDGSVPEPADHPRRASTSTRDRAVDRRGSRPLFPHDAAYLDGPRRDFARWADGGFGVPDFLDSLVAFQPQRHRVDGIRHLVVFPMYTQNGSRRPARRGRARSR